MFKIPEKANYLNHQVWIKEVYLIKYTKYYFLKVFKLLYFEYFLKVFVIHKIKIQK